MPILAADRFLSIRIKSSMWRDLRDMARARDMSVSEYVRMLIVSVTHQSHDTSVDVADTIAAQPIAKPTFTGNGRHDDFARAAAIGRRHEATATARQFISTMNHASAPDTSREALTFARAHGVLAD